MSHDSQFLIRIAPSRARRFLSTGLILVLSIWLFYNALVTPPASLPGQVAMLLLAGATLYIALRSHAVRGLGLVLTESALTDSTGRVLTPLDAIARVERGAFAFKPSNGFVLHLKKPAPRAWVPGLWWRIGTRLGVGGATKPAETKVMADRIAFLLAGR